MYNHPYFAKILSREEFRRRGIRPLGISKEQLRSSIALYLGILKFKLRVAKLFAVCMHIFGLSILNFGIISAARLHETLYNKMLSSKV